MANKLFIVLIILGIPVGAWYFIRSAVASGVRTGRRDDKSGPPPEDSAGPDQG